MKALVLMFCMISFTPAADAQYPPLQGAPSTAPRPREIEHRLPADEPEQVQAHLILGRAYLGKGDITNALSKTKAIGGDMGYGRIDLYQSLMNVVGSSSSGGPGK